MKPMCVAAFAGLLCGVASASTVTFASRTLLTNASVDSGGNVVSDPRSDMVMGEGTYDHGVFSSATLGESFAFSSASQVSGVSNGLLSMAAGADAGGLAAGGDVVSAHAESKMLVTLSVPASETWKIDIEASGFDDAFAFVELSSGGTPVFTFDTRLGQASLHETVALPAGEYTFTSISRSTLDGAQIGGLRTIDMTFERQVGPACPGDANGDNVVDFLDLNIVLSDFGQMVYPGMGGDLNGDGGVDFLDLNIVLSFFGVHC